MRRMASAVSLVKSTGRPTVAAVIGLMVMADDSYTLLTNGLPGTALPSNRTSVIWLPDDTHTSSPESRENNIIYNKVWFHLKFSSNLTDKQVQFQLCLGTLTEAIIESY